MSTSFSPQIGERFAGRYELKSPLRSEGAVRAFLALDHHAGLDVALLLLDPTCAHPNAWAAFARIVAAATASKIAGLVLPQGVASTPPAPPFCLAEPRVFRGFDKLRDQGPMPWRRALMLGERTAEILHAAHAATGVAHRILTPSRCTLTIRDDVRVIDFGVAELELGSPDEAGYRAPEQRQGGGDSRSDAYTLAVILTELITNQKSAGQTPPRLRSLAAVPQPVDDFMARALSQDPAQRPDLAAMRAGLRELLSAAEATTAAAPRPKPRRDFSSLSIRSAPPGARAAPSVMPSTKPGPAVGVGPGLANVASQPVRPSLPSIAKAAAPRMSSAEVSFQAPAAFKTELLPPAPPTAAPAAFKTELLPPVSSTPAPALTDRTEIFPPVSSTPAPPLTDRTEIFPPVSSTPSPPLTVRTELLPPVLRLTPVNGERTEVVRADIAIVREEQAAPEKSLRGSFALAQAKASAAVLVASPGAAAGADPPTENIADPLPPVDTTLLLPPEPARPVPAVEPPAFDPLPPEPQARSTAEVRPPADRVQATPSARSPTIAKPVKSSFKSTWMWIGALCLAGLVLAALWLLIT
ncbi:hypothetical protein [Nannocystis bainbridge]|uniref:Protein kinase domain-containing protein n=1 Tax=Nannocystis bainbridge TaxID=2995303 RepID=A0ABT5DSY3_9BACT|nr:hypothetical protein [Nannocystis bainbridge]MDC0716689.1 hypothetical protein [Nannocystis bainbridge]